MAEGGEDLIDFNDDHDDEEEEEVDTTRHFQPRSVSTPRGGWEQYEMQTYMHEQSGLPDHSYEETPLLGAQTEAQRSWDSLTRLFPRASAINLETSYSKTGRLQVKMSGFGKKSYPLFTKDKSSGIERINPNLTKEIKDSLGTSAEEIIAEDRDTIREQRQRLAEFEAQQRQAEVLSAEREKHAQEIQTLGQQIEKTQADIDAIQERQGTNLESEAQINRLKLMKKNLKASLDEKKKELAAVEKQSKDNKSLAAEREKK